MKRAFVLCGGGSLGAYEVGVWRYLREKNVSFDLVCGTSIGSLIGAMVVNDDFERCLRLWETLTVDAVIANGINLSKSALKRAKPSQLLKAAGSYLRHRGADISPFRKMVEEHIDPRKLKQSKIDFALVVTTYPMLRERDILVKDLPEGEVRDYLCASSSCWPLFPITKIGKKRYVDGGFTNNLPIDLAIRLGADEIIAVRLKSYPPVPQHAELMDLPFVTTIGSAWDLGGVMNFDHGTMMNHMELGYLDAKKRFGDSFGFRYAFSSWGDYEPLANRFLSENLRENPLLFAEFQKALALDGGTLRTSADFFLRTLETIGEWLGLSPFLEYDVPSFWRICHDKAKALAQRKETLERFREERPRRSLAKADRAAFLSCLLDAMERGKKARHILAAAKRHPETLLIRDLFRRCL